MRRNRRRLGRAGAVLAVLAASAALVIVERRWPGPAVDVLRAELALAPPAPLAVADALALERALAEVDGQLAQPAGLTAAGERPLLAAVAALGPAPGEAVGPWLRQTFPARGAHLQALLECFAGYQPLASDQQPVAEPQQQALARLLALQRVCFGEPLAQRLFSSYVQLYRDLAGAEPPRIDPSAHCPLAACQVLRVQTAGR